MIGVCGEALIDFTPAKIDEELAFMPRPGGSPLNVATGLARLGKSAAFIGKISNDVFGDMLQAHLTRNGIDMRWGVRGNEPSALAFVIPSDDGGHDFSFYGSHTAEQSLTIADVPALLPDELTALHFGSYSLMLGEGARTYEGLMRREHGSRVISLDPNVRPALFPHRSIYRERIEGLLSYATLVKASAEDLAWLYPTENYMDIAARWLTAGPAIVVVTLGAEGAVGMSGDAVVRAPGLPVDVADTVGAGDAFMSALLAWLDDRDLLRRDALATLGEAALTDAMVLANRVAAITCTRQGADPPTRAQIQ
ncbi:MAG: carbohydrate kinase [Chloroflexi bacterium]|nr:carbohydrate kinase [Chloroflexota bacterium]